MTAAVDRQPRLLYVGDVPVEATVAGAALIYRLFDGYPAERLTIFQSSLPVVRAPDKRLPGVTYHEFPVGSRRLLDSRVSGWYAAVLLATAEARASGIAARISSRVDGIVTVAHGYSWLTAARLSATLGVPLHMVLHDDCIATTGIAAPLRGYAERLFATALSAAATRFSASPGMQEHCRASYGVSSELLLPMRARDAIVFDAPPAADMRRGEPFTAAYAGSLSAGYVPVIERLWDSLRDSGGRLLIFTADASPALRARLTGADFHPFVSARDLPAMLRERADALFVPMSFAGSDAENMRLGFPSKLADLTAVGLPIVIAGPENCSAVRWARQHAGVALVVTTLADGSLADALIALANDEGLRGRLAREALRVGAICFDHHHAQQRFFAAMDGIAVRPS